MLVCSGQAFAAAETPTSGQQCACPLGWGWAAGRAAGATQQLWLMLPFPGDCTGTADTGTAGTGTAGHWHCWPPALLATGAADTSTAGHRHCRHWHCWPPVLQTPALQATAAWERQLVQAAACQRHGLRQLGCGHVPCASQGKRLHPGACSVVSYGNAIAEPARDGQSSTRPGSRQCLCLQQALPTAFPPSREGQILSIAPALKSLLPIAVRNSPGLGVSYLWPPVRKEECTELPRPPFPQPHALPSC